MEEACFVGAVIAFALAVCSLIACVAIFVRAGVPDAIRFLQHRPAKKPSSSGQASGRRARAQDKGGASAGSDGPAGDDLITSPDGELIARKGDSGTLSLDGGGIHSTEDATDLLPSEGSESPTGLLAGDESENPTGLLGAEASENPTGLLQDREPASPASLSGSEGSEGPTGLLAGEDSENPTGLLNGGAASDSEHPTGLLIAVDDSEEAAQGGESKAGVSKEDRSGVAQQEETTFRFILKQSELVVHTQEAIA